MTKDEYISKLRYDQKSIIYEYYRIKNKRPPFLSYKEFLTFSAMGLDIDKAFITARNYFEAELNIVYLLNKQNEIITIL
jgi:hypothetical protein